MEESRITHVEYENCLVFSRTIFRGDSYFVDIGVYERVINERGLDLSGSPRCYVAEYSEHETQPSGSKVYIRNS